MRKLGLVLLMLAMTGMAEAGRIAPSKKFGVGLWRTTEGKFATIQMGGETWYLYSEQCVQKAGNCYYKFWAPSMRMYMDLENGMLNFMPLQYNLQFK